MKTSKTIILATAASLTIALPALAQGAGTGPVARQCAEDIKKFCAGMQHGSGEVRACLEAKKAEASAACKEALDTTGPGKGKKQ
jgi:hypothetical protein